jgi:non-heme chloroperoxidase
LAREPDRSGLSPQFLTAVTCVRAFSETDFWPDLKNFTMPTLVIHAVRDQTVSIDISARASWRRRCPAQS